MVNHPDSFRESNIAGNEGRRSVMPLSAKPVRFEVHRNKDKLGVHFYIYDLRFGRYINLVWHGDEGRTKAHEEAKRLELEACSSHPLLSLC